MKSLRFPFFLLLTSLLLLHLAPAEVAAQGRLSQKIQPLGDLLIFHSPTGGLWRTDGTAAGTFRLAPTCSTNDWCEPIVGRVGHRLFFLVEVPELVAPHDDPRPRGRAARPAVRKRRPSPPPGTRSRRCRTRAGRGSGTGRDVGEHTVAQRVTVVDDDLIRQRDRLADHVRHGRLFTRRLRAGFRLGDVPEGRLARCQRDGDQRQVGRSDLVFNAFEYSQPKLPRASATLKKATSMPPRCINSAAFFPRSKRLRLPRGG